jgi:geranylgeranyl pyrophosphate synthase
MNENRLSSQEILKLEEPWQLYYTRKKYSAERTIQKYVVEQNNGLSEGALSAVKHGILTTKGKRVRPVLTHLIHDLVDGHSPLINNVSILAELPHRGSLLEDDIDDNSPQRDGHGTAHELFGIENTQEACNFLYRAPVSILNSLPIEDEEREGLIDDYKRLSVIARVGQQKDVSWGKNDYIPTIDEYLQMCEEKCAAFEYAIRVGAHFGGASSIQTDILVTAGNKTATAFQLIDDLLSLNENSDDYGSDITEGKKTVPVILSAQSTNGENLLDILRQHTDDPYQISTAIRLITESGGISATHQIARGLVDEAQELILHEFDNTKFRRILFSIMEYGLQRSE